MKITVQGLWHLGSVTAACCARHFHVTGLDFDPAAVARLNSGHAPLLEPGLDALLSAGIAAGNLSFTTDPTACADSRVLWLCYDTPVNDNDEPDAEWVLANLCRALLHLKPGALVLISSQLPVGSCARLEKQFPQFHFACSPENLRLGRAIEAFEKADRIVAGIRHEHDKPLLQELLAPFTPRVLFMGAESAEMVKHALNSFLALSITFINEIARLCEHVGANARDVAAGLKSEARIGPRAYLGPGGPFAGGTLARDVVALTKLGERTGEKISVIPAIKQSNDLHKGWALARLRSILGDLRGKKIAVLGLTYTVNTDTLRRSAAVELCERLVGSGAEVAAFDPAVRGLPPGLSGVSLAPELPVAIRNADAVAVCTEWPDFRNAPWPVLVPTMRGRVFVDANCFLEKELKDIAGITHLSVGRNLSPKQG
ncbi:MAG: nucleotide sugar dehydrogenase [Verrucomicrobia bacterium]|nr:nucleotide sugar dehydrogenase [Verrucomicrobiota bacterium]MDE3098601.1 UDP-glucose/GDP-mannose dehydrogenase family protein [Verrucomicrobiota bacterium]